MRSFVRIGMTTNDIDEALQPDILASLSAVERRQFVELAHKALGLAAACSNHHPS